MDLSWRFQTISDPLHVEYKVTIITISNGFTFYPFQFLEFHSADCIPSPTQNHFETKDVVFS